MMDGQLRRFDLDEIRADFPILARKVHGKPLVYLDSAASAQKPRQVIDALTSAYLDTYANVHRGLHFLSETSTDLYEDVRGKVAGFLGAKKLNEEGVEENNPDEIVLTSSATAAFNLVARSWAETKLGPGDEILISIAEHHANIVPWQLAAQKTGAVLRAFELEPDGGFNISKLTAMVGKETKIISVPHVSNVLGTVFPLERIARVAHDAGALMVVDGCQGAPHMAVDVSAIGADVYIFAPHKLYGPNGVGVMWAKGEILEQMPPFMGGGDMIEHVTIEGATYVKAPLKFEAGTPAIAETIALGAAIDYVQSIGMDAIREHELEVLDYAHERLGAVKGLTIIGTAPQKSGVVSFIMDCAHPHDISTIIDRYGVAIRVGHHCALPLMDHLGLTSTARASIGVYTRRQEFDRLAEALEKVRKIFG